VGFVLQIEKKCPKTTELFWECKTTQRKYVIIYYIKIHHEKVRR